jgi:protein ImuB
MLWACLALPQLPLEIAFRGDPQCGPRLLYSEVGQRVVVVQADNAATAAGIHPGQNLGAARALLPNVLAKPRQSHAESAVQETLAAWAYGFSSQVLCLPPTPQLPAALALEVGGSLKLFDGWPGLSGLLRDGMRQLGHAHSLACAPSVAGARLLASAGHDGMAVTDGRQLQHALAQLTLTQAGLAPRQLAALQAMGLRRLGDVFTLPRPELARRLGPELLDWLDRLRGRRIAHRPNFSSASSSITAFKPTWRCNSPCAACAANWPRSCLPVPAACCISRLNWNTKTCPPAPLPWACARP